MVQAALVAVDSMAGNVAVLLDPRPELREDSLTIPVINALKRVGYTEYGEPSVPPRNLWLLSPGTINEWNDSTFASAMFWAYGSREGFLNSYSYSMTFQVEVRDSGLILGHWHSRGLGDGHLPAKCWDDFYGRTEKGRRKCFTMPLKEDTVGVGEAEIS